VHSRIGVRWGGERIRASDRDCSCKSMFRVLRIEFNHNLLDYYTGIDAVLLTRIKWKLRCAETPEKLKPLKGTILQKLEIYDFQPQRGPPETIENFLKNDLNKFIKKKLDCLRRQREFFLMSVDGRSKCKDDRRRSIRSSL
jgi:hypothetical protein